MMSYRTFRHGRAIRWLLVPVGVLGVAALPLIAGRVDGVPRLTPMPALEAIASWIRGLADGTSFEYRMGATRWNFMQTAPSYLWSSFVYFALAGSIGIAGGMVAGLTVRGSPARWIGSVLDTIFAIPDFILAIVLQLAVIVVLDASGIKLARISHDATTGPVLALPLVLLTVYPLAWSFRTTLRAVRDATDQQFVTFALARGLSPAVVLRRHIGAAVFPVIEAEVPTMAGILQANLFMAEYLFSVPGITRFLFLVAFSGRRPGWMEWYQYQLAVDVLFGVVLLYAAAWMFFKGALRLARRVVTGER